MTMPALALFYGGLVQAKNCSVGAGAVLRRGLHLFGAVVCLRLYRWLSPATVPGWAIAPPSCCRIVTRGGAHPGTRIPESVFVMFQMTFAVITPALIIGAYVERIRFCRRAADLGPVAADRLCPRGALGVGRRLAGPDAG